VLAIRARIHDFGHCPGGSEALFRADHAEKDDVLRVFGGDALTGFTTIRFYVVNRQDRPPLTNRLPLWCNDCIYRLFRP
jgi:hypothetical protein